MDNKKTTLSMADKIHFAMSVATDKDKSETNQRADFQKMLGISQGYLSLLLRGKRDPSKKMLKKIVEASCLKLDFFLSDNTTINEPKRIYAEVDKGLQNGIPEEKLIEAIRFAVKMTTPGN